MNEITVNEIAETIMKKYSPELEEIIFNCIVESIEKTLNVHGLSTEAKPEKNIPKRRKARRISNK